MKNSDKYRKAFNNYYDLSINDQETLQMIRNMERSGALRIVSNIDNHKYRKKEHAIRRWAFAMVSILVICSSVTMIGIAAGWPFFADIFHNGFQDEISADLVKTGTIQELNIIEETEEYVLKLVAFTGDIETQIVLFELTPKVEWPQFDEIYLYGRTFYPSNWEDGSYKNYGVSKTSGYKVDNSYYFRYKLPSYWIQNISDIMIQVTQMELYQGSSYVKNIDGNLRFTITPDRDILAEPLKIEVNEFFTKNVFNKVGSPLDKLTEGLIETKDVIAPLTERTVKITDVIISKYKTEVKGLIYDESISSYDAGSTWNQFTEPQLITEHYYNGLEESTYYNMVAVDNKERIRLFVDDIEYEVNPESLEYGPGKGHDANGNMLTEGYYGCSITFPGFDYEQASKVEIRFGDKSVYLK